MKTRTTTQQRALLVAFGVATAVAAVIIAEVFLATLGVGDPALGDDPFVGFEASPSLFMRQGDGADARYVTRPEKLVFFNEQSFPVTKAPGTLRIFTLGGSTTAGRPYDDHVSFSRWLERYLDAAEPGRRHEVINAGAISYASYRVARLMDELVDYEPDVFIVLTGHNEFLEERSYRELRDTAPWRRSVRAALSHLRLSRVAWAALESPPENAPVLPAEVKTRLDVWTGLQAFERDNALRRQVASHFTSNLERMARLARGRGVDLVFVPPASNLKDFSPFKSQHGEGLAAADRAAVVRLLDAGRADLAGGQPAEAAEALGRAVELDGEYALTWFLLGRAHLEMGAYAEAEAAFVRAKELDVAPLRALEAFAARVPAVADAGKASWLDWPALLRARNEEKLGHGIVGDESFLDHVHPSLAVHQDLARALVSHFAERGLIEPGSRLDIALAAAIDAEVLDGLDAGYYARRDVNLAKVLGWAGKLAEAEAPLLRARPLMQGDADFHLALGTLWQKMGRSADAVVELERAAEIAPQSAEASFNLAVVYGRLGRSQEAIGRLEALTERFPGYGEAWQNLGVIRRQAGDLEGARTALESARDLEPERPEIHRSLAVTYRALGRMDEADEAHRAGLRLEESPTGRRELAITLATSGRVAEAEAELNAALRADPDDAETHYARARLLAESGRAGAAEESYRRTLELDPAHVRALNNLGIALAAAGDLAAAHRHLVRAVELDPTFAEAFLNLGVVFDRAGQPEPAIAAIRRSLELQPDQPRAHLAVGLLLRATGHAAEAGPHLRAAQKAGLAVP